MNRTLLDTTSSDMPLEYQIYKAAEGMKSDYAAMASKLGLYTLSTEQYNFAEYILKTEGDTQDVRNNLSLAITFAQNGEYNLYYAYEHMDEIKEERQARIVEYEPKPSFAKSIIDSPYLTPIIVILFLGILIFAYFISSKRRNAK